MRPIALEITYTLLNAGKNTLSRRHAAAWSITIARNAASFSISSVITVPPFRLLRKAASGGVLTLIEYRFVSYAFTVLLYRFPQIVTMWNSHKVGGRLSCRLDKKNAACTHHSLM